MRGSEIAGAGMVLVLVGILVILAGIFKEMSESRIEGAAKSEVRGGGVILIGPFPIVFGTDKQSAVAVVILTIILIIVAWVFLRR